MNKFAKFVKWAHGSMYRTWAFHALQAFLISAATYVGFALLPGSYSENLRLGVAFYACVLIFAHREISDLLPVIGTGVDPTDKLKDGFGDFWSVPVGVAAFALLVSVF